MKNKNPKEWTKNKCPTQYTGTLVTGHPSQWVNTFRGKLFSAIGQKYFLFKGKYIGRCISIKSSNLYPNLLKIQLDSKTYFEINTDACRDVKQLLEYIKVFDTESDARLFAELDDSVYPADWYYSDLSNIYGHFNRR